jgi:hypothetical protein
MQTEEEASFGCRATAAFLRSGGAVAAAGHVAALMTIVVKRDAWAIVIWSVALYFGVRVRIDVEFFDLLATHPAQQLDRWLSAAGLRKNGAARSIADRRRGAMQLWWGLVCSVALQIALLLFRLIR